MNMPHHNQESRRKLLPVLITLAVGVFALAAGDTRAANFTRGAASAKMFGTHEIVLTGDGSVTNPFNTVVTLTFVPPSGKSKIVHAFYDGGDAWRARAYITEVGRWRWSSASADDPQLNNKSGSFTAARSDLRGMLRKHKENPRQWMTDDGRWFVNLNDTPYMLFKKTETRWQDYVKDIVAMGMTSVRSGALGGVSWDKESTLTNWPWKGDDKERYDLEKFQTTDERLQWLLDTHPNVQVQMILFGLAGGKDEPGKVWAALPPQVRANTMRYMVARWAAYPQIFWLVVNDMFSESGENQEFAREVGRYFAANDPWGHLLSAGVNRTRRTPNTPFPFITPDDFKWVNYIHLETAYDLAADQLRRFADIPLHVFCGEDYYEQEYRAGLRPLNPRYFYRRLFWSWLLAGGSPNYGSRWRTIHPYKQTGRIPEPNVSTQPGVPGDPSVNGQLVGLDSVPYIKPFFDHRKIELWRFTPDDTAASDMAGGARENRPKVMRRGTAEYLIYHPNAKSGGRDAALDSDRTARCQVDLTRALRIRFAVEWFRVHDGVSAKGGTIRGGAKREFTAPWPGQDVVLYLKAAKRLTTPTKLPV